MASSHEGTIAAGMSSMAVASRTVPMMRPSNSHGRAGRSSVLLSNFFELAVKNLPAVYQYDVAILRVDKSVPQGSTQDPDVASEQPVIVNRNIFSRFVLGNAASYVSRIAYDGRKIAYSPAELPVSLLNTRFALLADRDGKGPQPGAPESRYDLVHVLLHHVSTMDTTVALTSKANLNTVSVQPVINALDVALAQGNTMRFVEVGRTFYSSTGARDLGGGAQAWRGFYQSIRMTEGGLAVNVDESFTPFWKETDLMSLLKAANPRGMNLPGINDVAAWRALGKDLHGLRVYAPHTGISYRVFGFSPKSAASTTFADKTGNRVSIVSYMRSEYSFNVTQPDLPCVKTNPKRDTFVPIEMLEVCKNQRRNKAMTPMQTSQMIRIAALKPADRKRSAESSVATANYNAIKLARISASASRVLLSRSTLVSCRLQPSRTGPTSRTARLAL
jgi:eukaryotic translation initiation factor 2C